MNLKELRLKNRYSQAKLAKEFGISQQMVSKYENNKLEMPYDLLIKTADFFNCSIDELIGREKNSNNIINLKLLSPIKQRVIKTIINSEDIVCQKFEAFFTGYFSGREQQLQDLINLSRGL